MSIRPSIPAPNSVSEGKHRASNTQGGLYPANTNNNSSILAPVQPKVAASVGLEDRPTLKTEYPDITQGRHRGFMIKVAAAKFVSHLPFLAMFIVYMVKKTNINPFLHSFFQGSPNMYFAYAVTCTVLLLLTILVPSAWPPAGRRGFGILLFFIYILCLCYLTVYVFHHESFPVLNGAWDVVLMPLACGFLYASFGALVTASLSIRKVPKLVAAGVGAVGSLLSLLLLWLVSETTNQKIWAWFVYILFGGVVGFYYAFDLEDMVRKRGHYYKVNDWFLGFAHLHTDPFFRLPRDLIFRRKQQPEIVQELEVAEPDVVTR